MAEVCSPFDSSFIWSCFTDSVDTLRLWQNGRQYFHFFSTFSYLKTVVFWCIFRWNLFPRVQYTSIDSDHGLAVALSRQHWLINSSLPSAAYMPQRSESSLVQVMTCGLFGTKPLPEPMLAYCQLDSWEHLNLHWLIIIIEVHWQLP